ncbi:MAG: hypothetical protein ACTHNZ_23040 [Trinickia sp.]|jgi:hypothetical protein|uniref:hypothetical protein n=1 Tax=Trinickia sp. TaxID=2571163 RepID=UPI003F7EE1B9
MKTWLGLLAAPTVVLGAQSADYMLVQFACRWGTPAPLCAVSALGFVFSAIATIAAFNRWRATSAPFPASYDARNARTASLALAAMVVGALCTLIQLTMWFPQWLLSPCL